VAGYYACGGWRWKADLPCGNLSGFKSLLETGKVLAIPPLALGIEGFEQDESED